MQIISVLGHKEGKRKAWIGYLYLSVLCLVLFRLFAYLSCFHMGPWTVYGFTMATALLSFILILLCFPEFSKYEKILWIGLIAGVFISWLTHFTALEYICNTAIFLSALTTLPKVRWEKLYTEILLGVFTAYIIFVLIFVNTSLEDKDSFVYMNPNGVCFLLVLYQFVLVAYARKQEKLALKIAVYTLALATVILQFYFGGRASLIGTGTLFVYCIFQNFFDKCSQTKIKWIITSVCLLSIAFAFGYAVILYGILGDDFRFLGKDLFTGREIIWLDAFKALRYRWPLGIGQTLISIPINGVEGPTNLHNVMMGYLTHFGVFATIFYALLFGVLTAHLGKIKHKTTVVFLIVMAIMGYFDTVLYSTDNVVYLPIVLTLIYQFDNQARSEKC